MNRIQINSHASVFPRSARIVRSLALLGGIAGLGCGCEHGSRQSASQSEPATCTTQAAMTPTGAPAASNQSGVQFASVAHHDDAKLDPMWFSMTAEGDPAMWNGWNPSAMGRPALPTEESVTASVAASRPMHIEASDDGAEGLSHVTAAQEGADFDPSVSRDGKYIAFASTQHRPTSAIYVKSVAGRTITQLTSDASNNVMPTFSPDGQRIAFCSNRNGNWDIFVMPVTGGQALQLTNDPSEELHPTWSPDGGKIAFCRLGQISGRWEMWVMDVNGPGAAEFLGYGMFPQWCPVARTGTEGRDKILFQRSRERGDHAFGIWTIDYRSGDASSPTEIVSAQAQAMINASWSADGTRVVYGVIANQGDMGARPERLPRSTLWMTNVDGSQRVLLASGPYMNLMPTWSKDGRIYFVSDRTGIPNIWSIGTERAITAATGHAPTKGPATEMTSVPEEHGAPAASH